MLIKHKAPSSNESRVIKFMILLGVFSIGNFLVYFFHPEHIGDPFLYGLLTISILYSIVKKLYLWYNYSNITIPKPEGEDPELKVDILTTYFPGEPYQMIITTLEAILNIHYPHETFLCDEANDPYLKQFCRENGIHHVTRNNRIDAKAGNINNALRTVAKGDICVILDPDHIPNPEFLDPILPYFNDPQIGFVQTVQAYYNISESLVARGAAEQTFQFYGPVMMTLNSYGTVNAIGANCVFRRAALDSIGGHAPGLCEDMHTAMLLYAKGWKAVYLPVVLAKGLAPSNLTSFFKQQLKWARGSFDLLLKVYPKIFHKLTLRQKLHFGILPMHYLSGLISLLNFLIPILALFFSTTPWRGNIIEFALVILPVIASSIFIRTYIQKWIIEKKERGFHLVGGLLHINTWWIYLLGLYYTITDKKILYLPTPKENEWATNLKIVVPNACVALVSIVAIIYGLNQDFTPFSLVMAGFALFNAVIMGFGIYVAIRFTNRNNIIRTSLQQKFHDTVLGAKRIFYSTANVVFNFSRILALPLLLLVLIFSMSFKQKKSREKWETVYPTYHEPSPPLLFGIFHPTEEGGLTNIKEVTRSQEQKKVDFDIISFYLAWDEKSVKEFPHQLTSRIFANQAIPMITWEPWASHLPVSDTIQQLQDEKKIFRYIAEGYYDDYLLKFIDILESYDKPLFLRFAHEFDNPQYPWSSKGNNTPEEFISAWRHIHQMLRRKDAHKIIMVWNPWKPEAMDDYYPGDEFVDWIGITALNYDQLNSNNRYTAFEELYEPYREEMRRFSSKPVMLSEFGSLNLSGRQTEWTENALQKIEKHYNEIQAVVLFHSGFDKNIPRTATYERNYLDWRLESMDLIKELAAREPGFIYPKSLDPYEHTKNSFAAGIQLRGVRYKKNINWRQNYYALTKEDIKQDLDLLREANINTMLFKGGNIYDYNILKYTEAANINVLYTFNIKFSADFFVDEGRQETLRKEILNKVKDQKNREHILGYVFPGNLGDFFTKPQLFFQRSIYYNWLQKVAAEIRKIDPGKPLILELSLSSETQQEISEVYSKLPIDAIALIVTDISHLKEVLKTARENDIPVIISSINPQRYTQEREKFADMGVILHNWQDERLFNRLTYDGIVDFEGRKKMIFKEVENIWTDEREGIDSTVVRVLRPAEPLYPGTSLTYRAVLFDGEQWRTPQEGGTYTFEWSLIQNDIYGNPLALKKIGEGAQINLEIPREYERYELLLTAQPRDKDHVIRAISPLHTPTE